MRLELYYPVRPYSLNQPFGGNLPCTEDRNDIPLDQRKVISGPDNNTCPVGYVKLYPLMGMPKGHTGCDLAAGEQNIYASCEGIVTEKQLEVARGLGLGITSEQTYELDEHGTHNVVVRYWHLKSFNVNIGDRIKVGDLIGISDSTGFSSADHVHFELKSQTKNMVGEWVNVEQQNGFFGALDPLPFFNGFYAEDMTQITLLRSAINIIKSILRLLGVPVDK